MKGLSQYDLSTLTKVKRSMISSYELDGFYPNLDSLNKLGTTLDINILCRDGYSRFLLQSDIFKDKLIKWRNENNLTKRDAAKTLNISERGYSLWEEGTIMSISTFHKVKKILIKYNLLS